MRSRTSLCLYLCSQTFSTDSNQSELLPKASFGLHNTGSLANGTIAGVFTGIPNFIITPITPKLIHKFGARNTAIGAGIFGGIAYTLMFIIGYAPFGSYSGAERYKNYSGGSGVANMVYLTVMLTICGLPNCIIRVCQAVLQGDVYDYSEWKYGVRNEGLVTTVSNYFTKLANAVTGLLSGLVITFVGYTSHKDALGNVIRDTSPKVLMGFFAVFALMPAIARFLFGIILIFFNVHGKFKEDMMKELEERRLERVRKMTEEEKCTRKLGSKQRNSGKRRQLTLRQNHNNKDVK